MSVERLESRLRTVSRIALYGSLALTFVWAGLLIHLASAPLLRDERLDWHVTDYAGLEEVQLLQEYVRIDTSLATGSSLEGARFLARQLDAAGVPYTLERVGDSDANLWAVVEGERPGAVVLHHHIDVEDVHDDEEWQYPPFSATIDLPWLYGRGTFDMKSVGIAQLLAVIDLVRSGVRPERSVIFLATTGEETGSHLGTRWVLREHPELVERFEVVLTEGGVLEGRDPEDVKYWGTEYLQKHHWNLVACSPHRESLEQLRQDVVTYGSELDSRLRLVDELRPFFRAYAPSRDREDFRRALADPEAIVRDRSLYESLPGYVQAMFRNEVHAFEVRAAKGGGWELPVKIHLLPGVRLDEVRDDLLPEWLFHGFDTVLEREPAAAHGSPVDHPAVQAIETVLRRHHPGARVGPIFLPWTATDSRFFRAHGIPSYGFSPFQILTIDVLRVGSVTERIPLPGFVDGVAAYRDVLQELVTDKG